VTKTYNSNGSDLVVLESNLNFQFPNKF